MTGPPNAEERGLFCGSFARGALLFAWTWALAGAAAQAAPTISDLAGTVTTHKAGAADWQPAARGHELAPQDQVKTGASSRATIRFDDGSLIELGASASLIVEASEPALSSLRLALGSLRAKVSKSLNRRFEVRTPTAVCAVRGTEFAVQVDAQGQTSVQMFTGLLAVSDQRGNETLLHDGESIRVTDAGLQRSAQALPATVSAGLKAVAQHEVGLEMTKEQVQTAAAIEAMNSVYKEGKTIIDVNGNRVRIEEYIVRPAADQFKLVVLNSRDDRFDYFYYHGVFNQALPDDLSTALRQLPGCIGAPCPYYLNGFDTGRSNTVDNMLERAWGGHQVDVNNDLYDRDAVTAAFDPATNQFVQLNVPNPGGTGNDKFYQTLFDNNVLTFNNVPHGGWDPKVPTIPNMSATSIDTTLPSLGSPASVTTVREPPACAPPDCTYNEAGVMHSVVYASNASGAVWEKYDSYVISDEGKLAKTSDFAGATSGESYKQTLLHWNFQTVVTASEFSGRKIDLAVEPKIFIESGLIQ